MSRYDTWLATTPEDDLDAALERQARREADAHAAEIRVEIGPLLIDSFAADYVYDPMRDCDDPVAARRAEYLRTERNLGAGWDEGLPF